MPGRFNIATKLCGIQTATWLMQVPTTGDIVPKMPNRFTAKPHDVGALEVRMLFIGCSHNVRYLYPIIWQEY